MDETKFDWDDLRLFLAVARQGGLAAAAASTGKSAPTLGRRMVTLEQRLGCELFQRLPRGYALTEDGERLLATAEALELRIRPLLSAAAQAVPVVKISAGTWVTCLLAGALPQIVGQDRVRLRFIAADQVVDIGRRAAVIGIRNQRPQGVGLAGRRLGRVRFAVYAGADPHAPWARVLGTTPSAQWVAATMGPDDRIEVTSPRTALDLALAGQARVVLPMFIGTRYAALTQCSPPIAELEHDQWLVTHHEDRYLPSVRKVIDRIAQVLLAATAAG
ncbi:LysR family transcriptional regulator [Actibacterium ureilyticum]|uniref:LysR family transcriptional regulator n=1 Tax=Actibacterium ureilyticum TaxID=1590614 RepID=UPI000BAAB839|nr:LysR family transcriptional regulator [Actibacterium ureilyticum]